MLSLLPQLAYRNDEDFHVAAATTLAPQRELTLPPATTNLPTTEATANTSDESAGITSLPDSLLLNIASFSDPPSMYNLIQTCSDFHRPSSELSSRHFLSSPRTAPRPRVGLSMTKTDAVKNVACRMVKESLVRGLVSVFQRSNACISREQARQLAMLQISESEKGRSVLLSGSTLVQAVTGKRFDNFDLDVYCTKESLTKIRGLLMEFGMVCQSALPYYGDEEDTLNTSGIHHVETYTLPNESTKILSMASVMRKYFRAKMAMQAAVEGDTTNVWYDRIVDMSYFNKRNECLHKMQRQKKYRFPTFFPITASPKGNGQKAIDIIVCKKSPEETIAQFDIEICKCTFDGATFHIISPDAFNLRSTASKFTKLGNQYMSYFLQPTPLINGTDCAISRLRSHDVTNEMMMHIIQCFLKAATEDNCKLPLLDHENALLNENISWIGF
eukprot:scaffold7692_cov121-Skeletonema_menzelii.AAC.1